MVAYLEIYAMPDRAAIDAPLVGDQNVIARNVRTAVEAVVPEIRARALATEQRRSVPPENITALRQAGLFKVLQPRAFGGYELGYELACELWLAVGAACASTGWVAGQYTAHQWLLANFPLQAQHDVWDENPDAVISVSYAPTGLVVPVDGGYRITGKWAWASGCDGADWGLCSLLLPPEREGGAKRPAFVILPKRDYVIEDVWHAIGLAGTGTNTLVVNEAFIPSHRVLILSGALKGGDASPSVHRSPLYRLPLLSCIPASLAAPAVAAAEGALAAYLADTGGRTTRGAVAGAGNRMAEFATIQLRVAEAAASVDAARTILLRDLRESADMVARGETPTAEQRIKVRRGQSFAVQLAVRALDALNASTGGPGLAIANPIQRAWRDAHAVQRHVSMNWDAVGTMYGQMALGLEPKGQY